MQGLFWLIKMSRWIAVLIYLFSGFVAAASQILMKKEAVKYKNENGFRRILHWKVIFAYGFMLGTVFLNMIAMRYIPYKYAPVMATFSYVFVLLLGKLILNEQIGKTEKIGCALILLGIVVFNFG